ncbi:GD20223 [Drosophila simulans]|uniref:GD20223 n=1 Tax=Drosophila simulans TaxID=7240 RepID=B4QVN7_DROSI|nr:GD20223 [Drosophila simulans]
MARTTPLWMAGRDSARPSGWVTGTGNLRVPRSVSISEYGHWVAPKTSAAPPDWLFVIFAKNAAKNLSSSSSGSTFNSTDTCPSVV